MHTISTPDHQRTGGWTLGPHHKNSSSRFVSFLALITYFVPFSSYHPPKWIQKSQLVWYQDLVVLSDIWIYLNAFVQHSSGDLSPYRSKSLHCTGAPRGGARQHQRPCCPPSPLARSWAAPALRPCLAGVKTPPSHDGQSEIAMSKRKENRCVKVKCIRQDAITCTFSWLCMCYVSSISNLCKYVTETVESISLGTPSNHMITIWWLDQDNSSGQHTNKPRPLGFQFSHHRASSSMTLSKRANCLASSTGVGRGVGQRSIDGPWPQPLWAVNQQKWMNWSQSWREHLKETPARF